MLKFFVDVCVGILLCTSPVDVSEIKQVTPVYDECQASQFEGESGYIEIKSSNDSLQEQLVIKQCDVTLQFNKDLQKFVEDSTK